MSATTNWPDERFGDVLEIRNGRNQREVENTTGPYPIYGSGGVMGYASDYICEANTTIIGRKGSINNPLYVEERYWTVDTAFGLHPSAQLHPRFLYYYCLHYDFSKHNRGTTIPSLVKTELLEIRMPVPPLPEQQRIVGKLDAAFAALTEAQAHVERNRANARELFESYLNGVFEGKGDVARTPMLELCEAIVDCEHKTAPTQSEGYPSIRTPNIGRGELLLDGVYRVSEETYQQWSRRAIPMPGDLILAREAPAGNVAVIPDGLQPCLGQRTVLIKPKRDVVQPKYLMYELLSASMQERLLDHSQGATVQHVNMKDIRALPIPKLPSLAEQDRIVNLVESMRITGKELESTYAQKLTELEGLKKGLLGAAFRGEL